MRPPLAPLGFSACRGLVASYAGAFLAPAGLLLAADYFAEAIATTTRRTQQFAKRQRTWFRRQHNPHWLEGQEALSEAISLIEACLD